MSILNSGNAVDAVVFGVLAAAAAHPSVLLGPLQAIVGGAGLGLQAVDGRLRQPGKGAPRPRGFREGDVIPLAARIAVPLLPHALSSLASTYGTRTFGAACTHAGTHCDRGSALHKVFSTLSSRGPNGVLERNFFGALESVAGRMEGGILTREDLETAMPLVLTPKPTRRGTSFVTGTPWDEPTAEHGIIHMLLAADRNGGFAAAVFEVATTGMDIAELGLVAPLAAAPVLRGQTRAKPGEPIPSPAPVRIWGDAAPEGIFGTSHSEALAELEQIARDPIAPPDASIAGAVGLLLRRQDGRVIGRTVHL